MIGVLKALLARGEVELVLVSCAERGDARFSLLDCDGYFLATLVCVQASVLCVTTHSAMYQEAEWYDRQSLPAAIDWLRESIPDGGGVLVLMLAGENEDMRQWGLPEVGRQPCAYIVCHRFVLPAGE